MITKRNEMLIAEKKLNIRFKVFALAFGIFLFSFLLISTASAQYARTNHYSPLGGIGNIAGGFFGETPGQFDRSMCEAGQDFVLQVRGAKIAFNQIHSCFDNGFVVKRMLSLHH